MATPALVWKSLDTIFTSFHHILPQPSRFSPPNVTGTGLLSHKEGLAQQRDVYTLIDNDGGDSASAVDIVVVQYSNDSQLTQKLDNLKLYAL